MFRELINLLKLFNLFSTFYKLINLLYAFYKLINLLSAFYKSINLLSAFYTGTVHVEVPQRMVHDALKRMDSIIQSENVDKNNITCEIVKESKVIGSAGGVILVTKTTTGIT
jgi:hypothetical protein